MLRREELERRGLMKRLPLPAVLKEFIDNYFEHRIARAAAALSFFLTLSVFPFLICANAMLSSMGVTSETVLRMGHNIVPEGTLTVIADYVDYVSNNTTPAMITAAIILLVTFSSAAYRTIMISMTEIQGRSRFPGVLGTILSFVFSLIFMAVIYAAGIVVISGNWLTGYIGTKFHLESIVDLWQRLKYLVLFLILLMILLIIYRLNAPRVKPIVRRLEGAFFASLVIVGVSVVFSQIIGLTSRYSLVYGSLASVIVLMLWLYLCANILLLGNVYNVMREKRRRSKRIRVENERKDSER